MHYFVSRNGQTYGPYTLDDLHRYLASGHILPTDLAQARPDPAAGETDPATSTDWVPVTHFIGTIGAASAATPGSAAVAGYQPASGMPAAGAVPLAAAPELPPNLSWGLVLLFDILTCSLFQMIWNIILGAWFRRVAPPSKTLWLYIASAILLLLQGGLGQTMGFAGTGHGTRAFYHHSSGLISYSAVALVCWITRLVARFNFRAELERHYNTVEPIGLRIDPVMTFFFGGIYLQSVMNRINDTYRYAGMGNVPR